MIDIISTHHSEKVILINEQFERCGYACNSVDIKNYTYMYGRLSSAPPELKRHITL